jgi:hypothetical protein
MAQNTLPPGTYELMQLAENMAYGLDVHGPSLRMMHASPVEFRDAVHVLRESDAELARLRRETLAVRTWMNAADKALTEWLGKARLAVMLARGVRWSEGWIEAGFDRTTTLPKAIGPRINLARRLIDFFARNPQFGVAHANVLASHGRKLYDDVVGAQQVRRQLMRESNHAKTVRDAAERKLRPKVRQVVDLLSASIKPNDPRWPAFGLNQPPGRSSKQVWLATPSAAPITPLTAGGEVTATASAAA